MSITIPNDVSFIINTFYENGYEAFMVGGCIRDSLLNKAPMDYDIATSAPPKVTEELFLKTIPTGINHGTVTILLNNIPYEVTTYRTEGTYINNRKPNSVTFVTDIKDDLSRRDFTINAFAYNDKIGLLDYYDGFKDLNNKLIRSVGIADNRFTEDALRMLRAIRFSSQLNFSIEEETYRAISSNSSLIKNISSERINSELSKILLSDNASSGLAYLKDTQILYCIIPELYNKNDLDYSIKIIDKLPKDISIRLASLLNHLDLDCVSKLLKRLTFDNLTLNKTLLLLRNYSKISNCNSKSSIKRLMKDVGKDYILSLVSLYEVYENTSLPILNNYITVIIQNKEALTIKDLNINGSLLKETLNLSSGKIIGEVLNHLLDLVIDDIIPNTYSALISEAENFIKSLSNLSN